MNHWENENKKKNIVDNFHLLTESQRLPNMLGQRLYNMLGQRLYNMLGQRLYNMLGQRLYNMLGQHFLDEQSEDGFASLNQRWPNENCSLKPNVGPTSTCYLGAVRVIPHEPRKNVLIPYIYNASNKESIIFFINPFISPMISCFSPNPEHYCTYGHVSRLRTSWNYPPIWRE